MLKAFVGCEYFFAGLGLIFKPGLKRYVVIPFIINLFLFLGLFFLFKHYFTEFSQWIDAFLPTWLHFLYFLLWLLFFLSFFIFFVYAFLTIGNIVAAPFNSLLAEQVEYFLTGKTLAPRSIWQNIKDSPRILARQLAIFGYYLPRAIIILILFFVPIIQAIAAIIWFVFNGWYLALTYLDYPTDNHRIPLSELRNWLKTKKWLALGFGCSTLFAGMIPFLNFFAIPAAVAGAVKLWIEENNDSVVIGN